MELIIAVTAIALIGLIYGVTRYFQIRDAKRRRPNPALDTVNTTNYNIKRLDDEELQNLSPQEAEHMVNYWRKSGFIPSHREFYAVQRVLRRDAKVKLKELQETW